MRRRVPPRPRFVPLRRASRRRREALLIVGPLLWVAALVVIAAVLRRTDAIEYALLVLAGSFLLSLAILSRMRAGRVRREREP